MGLRRLAKRETALEEKLKKEAKRYNNKNYPSQMVHSDTKRLPLLKGQKTTDPREYLLVAVDDCSREPLRGEPHPAKTHRTNREDRAGHPDNYGAVIREDGVPFERSPEE